jgi:hypothetical protein
MTGNMAKIFSLGEELIFIITPTKKKERLNNRLCDLHIVYKFLPGFSDKQLCIDLGAKKPLSIDMLAPQTDFVNYT